MLRPVKLGRAGAGPGATGNWAGAWLGAAPLPPVCAPLAGRGPAERGGAGLVQWAKGRKSALPNLGPRWRRASPAQASALSTL